MENTTSTPTPTPVAPPPIVESPVPPISPAPPASAGAGSTPVESKSAPESAPTPTPVVPTANLSEQLTPPASAGAGSTPVEPKPAPQKISFSQKLKLIRKKYEYINSQKMEPAAAEERARADLNLPEMTDSERAKAGRKNIFEKILTLIGFDKKPSAKVDSPAEQNSAPSDSTENQNPSEQF